MSQKHNIALLVFSLLCSSFSDILLAQTVDPCQYGCPKSGCPKCPEGGPIKAKDGELSKLQAASGESCVTECQNENRRQVKICDTFYPPATRFEEHKACLNKAKDSFDSCKSKC